MNCFARHLPRVATLAIAWLLAASTASAVPLEFQADYDDGFDAGYTVGYDSGFDVGQLRGFEEGSLQGQEQGYNSGWDDAYTPAYDLAYTLQQPVGVEQGYVDGLLTGFDEGYEWAKSVAAYYQQSHGISFTIISDWDWYDGSAGAIITVSGGILEVGGPGSSGTFTLVNGVLDVDLAAHYYDEGLEDGKSSGFSAGDSAGYDEAFPAAFSAAFDAAYQDGSAKGAAAGTADGGLAGFDAGWSLGFDEGQPIGFDAGIDYFLYGRLNSTALAETNLQAHVPEPTGLAAASMALVALAVGACRRR
jgi:hypothetical protein